jgi:hypothetical protein
MIPSTAQKCTAFLGGFVTQILTSEPNLQSGLHRIVVSQS